MCTSVIAQFGGVRRLSRLLGHKNPSTVQGWQHRKVIPIRQHREVLEAAKLAGIALQPVDLTLIGSEQKHLEQPGPSHCSAPNVERRG